MKIFLLLLSCLVYFSQANIYFKASNTNNKTIIDSESTYFKLSNNDDNSLINYDTNQSFFRFEPMESQFCQNPFYCNNNSSWQNNPNNVTTDFDDNLSFFDNLIKWIKKEPLVALIFLMIIFQSLFLITLAAGQNAEEFLESIVHQYLTSF